MRNKANFIFNKNKNTTILFKANRHKSSSMDDKDNIKEKRFLKPVNKKINNIDNFQKTYLNIAKNYDFLFDNRFSVNAKIHLVYINEHKKIHGYFPPEDFEQEHNSSKILSIYAYEVVESRREIRHNARKKMKDLDEIDNIKKIKIDRSYVLQVLKNKKIIDSNTNIDNIDIESIEAIFHKLYDAFKAAYIEVSKKYLPKASLKPGDEDEKTNEEIIKELIKRDIKKYSKFGEVDEKGALYETLLNYRKKQLVHLEEQEAIDIANIFLYYGESNEHIDKHSKELLDRYKELSDNAIVDINNLIYQKYMHTPKY